MNIFQILNEMDKMSLKEQTNISNTNINWKHILPNMKLSEKILEIFADQLDWNDVIRYQNISDDLFLRHKFRIK